MRTTIIPLQCSTCAYYQRGECCCHGGRYEGETMTPDDYCREWVEK